MPPTNSLQSVTQFIATCAILPVCCGGDSGAVHQTHIHTMEQTVLLLTKCASRLHVCGTAPLQVAEVVAQVLLQAQTDVLVEVAADPSSPPQGLESAVAEVNPSLQPSHRRCLWHKACSLRP